MANKQDYIREITLLNYNDAAGDDEGMDFFWKEYTNANFNGVTPTANYDNVPSNWSWIVPYSSRGNREPSLVASPYYMEGAMLYVKLTATITTSENGVDLVLNTQGKSACGCLPNYSFYTLKADQTNGLYTNSGLVVNEYSFWHYWIWVNGSDANYYMHFNTLVECFTHLIYNVRNINIFVDEEDWTEREAPITYNWVSVPSVSGKNGIISFSMVNETYMNDGNAVTGASEEAIKRLIPDTNIHTLRGNIPYNAETDMIYSGSVDKMTMEVIASESGGHMIVGGQRLRFYIADQQFYSLDITGTGENQYLHFIIDDENEVAKLSIITRNTLSTPATYNYNNQTFSDSEMHSMWLWLHSHVVDDEDIESTDSITNDDEGGEGFKPWIDVPINETGHPTTSAIETGFTTMYNVTKTQLQALSAFMWSETFLENITKFFNDPSDIIIGLMMLPVTGSIAGSETEIKAARVNTGVNGKKLTSQYYDVDMGEISVDKETYTFLDYPPIASAALFLPYCGEHSIDLNDILGKTIKLKYTFDMLSGACIARIKVDGSVKYQYSGQCGVQIPTSAADYGRVYSGILSAGATIGGVISTIASGGLTAPLLAEAGTLINNMSNMAPKVNYSSGGGGNTGFIGQQMPFLKLELANPLMANDNNDIQEESETEIEATRQYNFVGKPCYRNLKLSSCTGFTKCKEVHLKNITGATDTELDMINSLLVSGVIITPENDRSAKPSTTPITAGNMVLTFIKCKSEKNVIGKVWGSSSGDTKAIEGKLIYNQSLLKPVFVIQGDVIGYNYCYIPLFDRYYYVSDIIAMQRDIEEIHFDIDVLNSFATQILNCRAIVERQEHKGNLYMSDGNMYAKANKRIVTVPFMNGSINHQTSEGKQCFVTSNDSYILTIAGGD